MKSRTHNPKFSQYTFNIRVLSVVVVIASCLVVLLGRMFYLQILQAEYFSERARHQQQSRITLELEGEQLQIARADASLFLFQYNPSTQDHKILNLLTQLRRVLLPCLILIGTNFSKHSEQSALSSG